MEKAFYRAFVMILVLSFSISAQPVAVETGLSKEEDKELSLDEDVIRAEEERLELLFDQISLFIHTDKLEQGTELFQKVVVSYKDKSNLATTRIEKTGYDLAGGLLKADMYKQSIEFLDQLQEISGDDSIVFYIRAVALENVGNKDEAAEWRQKAAANKADDEKYRSRVGQFFYWLKRTDIAASEFQKVLDMPPEGSKDDADANLFLGKIASDERRFQDSAERYRLVAEFLRKIGFAAKNPVIVADIVDAHLNAAREFELKGQFDKELEVLQLCEKYFPQYRGLLNAIANAYIHLEKYDEAAEKFETYIDLYPVTVYADPFVGYGDVLVKLGKKEEAEKQYQKAIGIYRENIEKQTKNTIIATNLNNLAWFYATHDRDLDEAIKLSKRSLEIRPDECAYIDTLAELYYKTGDKEKAMETIKQAIDKNPPHLIYYQQQLEKFQGKGKPGPDKVDEKAERDE